MSRSASAAKAGKLGVPGNLSDVSSKSDARLVTRLRHQRSQGLSHAPFPTIPTFTYPLRCSNQKLKFDCHSTAPTWDRPKPANPRMPVRGVNVRTQRPLWHRSGFSLHGSLRWVAKIAFPRHSLSHPSHPIRPQWHPATDFYRSSAQTAPTTSDIGPNAGTAQPSS